MKEKKVKSKELDGTTEEKIKAAAKKLFTQKGFAATKTRDIASEAGINLALLNYYFRSKEKLFEIVMFENLKQFLEIVKRIFNDEELTLESKIESFVSSYIDLFISQPDIPLFILSEIRANPEQFVGKTGIKEFLLTSDFFKQAQVAIKDGKMKPVHPLHFIMNLIGLIVFPFVGSPLLKSIGNLKNEEYNAMMMERKRLIPEWIKSMMSFK